MRTKLILTLCSILHLSTFFCQNPSFAWAHSWGSSAFDNATKVLTDAAGDVYFVGTFQNTVDFDPGPGIYNLTAVSGADVFFCKLDAAGNFLWANSLGGPGAEMVYDMTFDPSGNINATGTFSSTTDFDPGAGTYTLTSYGNMDIFVLKLTPSGNFVQAVQVGGNSLDIAQRIHCDALGNTYVVGRYLNVADFDPGPGTYTLSHAIDGYSYILKLDAIYNFLWAQAWGRLLLSPGGGIVNNSGIATDAANNVYITGCFGAGPAMDVAPGPATVSASTGSNAVQGQNNRDIFLIKLTASGNYCWTKQLGDLSNDEALNITINANKIYLSGYFQLAPDFDPGPITASLTSLGAEDVFVLKLDTAANYIWARSIGSTTTDISYALGMNSAGNIYFTGVFGSTMDCDPNAGVFNVSSLGGDDAFVVGLDALGNFVWAKSYGGLDNEASRSIAVLPGGAMYTAGNFSGTCNFDPTASNYTLTEVGASDAFVHKLNFCLTPLTVSVTSSQSVICTNQSFTLSVFGASNYTLVSPTNTMNLWNTNVVLSLQNTTTYTVLGSDANGCSSSAVFTQSVSTCTQILENNKQHMSHIYPNPFSDKIVIESDHSDVVEITDLWGKVVLTKEIGEGRETIDLSKCNNGLYFVKTSGKAWRLVKSGQ